MGVCIFQLEDKVVSSGNMIYGSLWKSMDYGENFDLKMEY